MIVAKADVQHHLDDGRAASGDMLLLTSHDGDGFKDDTILYRSWALRFTRESCAEVDFKYAFLTRSLAASTNKLWCRAIIKRRQ